MDDKIKSVLTDREYLSYLEYKKIKFKWKVWPHGSKKLARYNRKEVRKISKTIYYHYRAEDDTVAIGYLDKDGKKESIWLTIGADADLHLMVKPLKRWEYDKTLLMTGERIVYRFKTRWKRENK